MAVEKLGTSEASQLLRTQAKAQASAAKSVASLLAASLDDPALGPVAETMANSVYASAEKALAQIEGSPLDQTALGEGRKTVQSIHEALVEMVGTREAYWKSYREKSAPDDAKWVDFGSGMISSHAQKLVDQAKEGPVATIVNSQQVMFAKPGDDADAVMARWRSATEVAEYGTVLSNMRSDLVRCLDKAEGLAAVKAAEEANPEGRSTPQLLTDLRALTREKLGLGPTDPLPPTAYISTGLQTLVHAKEAARLIAYAAADVRDNHDTSFVQFAGNVRYAVGKGLNQTGTDSIWNAALEQLKKS